MEYIIEKDNNFKMGFRYPSRFLNCDIKNNTDKVLDVRTYFAFYDICKLKDANMNSKYQVLNNGNEIFISLADEDKVLSFADTIDITIL